MGIRIDYSKDDKRVRDLKRVYSDLIKMKQLDKDHNVPDKVQNNLFVGSSAELQKLLKVVGDLVFRL